MNSPSRKRTPSIPPPLILKPKIKKTYLSPKPTSSPSSPIEPIDYLTLRHSSNISSNNSQPEIPNILSPITPKVHSSSSLCKIPSSLPNCHSLVSLPQYLRKLPEYHSLNFNHIFEMKVEFCKRLFTSTESNFISQKAAIFQEFLTLFSIKVDISNIPVSQTVNFFNMLKMNIFRISPNISLSAYERDDFIFPQQYDISCLPFVYKLLNLLQESPTHSVFFDINFFKQVLFHFNYCDSSECVPITKCAITYIRKNEDQIPQIFKLLKSELINFNDGLLSPFCIAPSLAIIYFILQKSPHLFSKTFITTVLLPLLRSPCYSFYRKEFVALFDEIITIPQLHILILYVFSSYLRYWPKTNDRKTIDFIMDASKIFGMLEFNQAKRFSRSFFLILAKCVVSVHSKVSEIAVSTILSQDLQPMIKDASKIVFPTLLKILLPANDPQLNQEGIRFVLNLLRVTNAQYYKSVCQSLNPKSFSNQKDNVLQNNREKWENLVQITMQRGYTEFMNIFI